MEKLTKKNSKPPYFSLYWTEHKSIYALINADKDFVLDCLEYEEEEKEDDSFLGVLDEIANAISLIVLQKENLYLENGNIKNADYLLEVYEQFKLIKDDIFKIDTQFILSSEIKKLWKKIKDFGFFINTWIISDNKIQLVKDYFINSEVDEVDIETIKKFLLGYQSFFLKKIWELKILMTTWEFINKNSLLINILKKNKYWDKFTSIWDDLFLIWIYLNLLEKIYIDDYVKKISQTKR